MKEEIQGAFKKMLRKKSPPVVSPPPATIQRLATEETQELRAGDTSQPGIYGLIPTERRQEALEALIGKGIATIAASRALRKRSEALRHSWKGMTFGDALVGYRKRYLEPPQH